MDTQVHIIGGGLAGSEAAWQLAQRSIPVYLYEMRPQVETAIHKTGMLAELVCSNSLKSTDPGTAAGLLKEELRSLGSMVLEEAERHRVPAGGALAVDRELFSQAVTQRIEDHPLITVMREEVTAIPDAPQVIIAAGPLVSDALAADIQSRVGADSLAFYDAAAPIVERESLDENIVFAQSRYEKGGGADYLNAPMDKEQYYAFIAALLDGERVIARDFEKRDLFTACQPVEEVARTGEDALRYGALKPVGIEDPRTGKRPWAVVQLRAEDAEGSAFNLVGFQTNLTFSEQRRIFRMIPGLEQAEFLRYGVMHRNTFIDSPHLLDASLALKAQPGLRFAGQITGTEGYTEAIASGLYAALCTFAELQGLPSPILPRNTAFGSLVAYATDPGTEHYQPMHVNFGLVEPLAIRVRGKKDRYAAYVQRAREEREQWLEEHADLLLL